MSQEKNFYIAPQGNLIVISAGQIINNEVYNSSMTRVKTYWFILSFWLIHLKAHANTNAGVLDDFFYMK